MAALRTAGFVVVELTDGDLWQRPEDARATVRAAIARAR